MATKKQSKAKRPDFKGFVNYPLSTDEKAAIKAISLTLDDYENFLIKLSEEGYKITISYDAFNQCYSCFLMHKDADHTNAGYMLSGKGSTPLKAFKQCSYIHYQIFDEDWSAHFAPQNRDEIDD